MKLDNIVIFFLVDYATENNSFFSGKILLALYAAGIVKWDEEMVSKYNCMLEHHIVIPF